jgi:hypothetical protein
MHFYKDDLNVYFVHIPRTGGRYVKKLLLSNQFKSNFNCPGETHYKGIEIMHLHESLLNDFNVYKNSKKFTIVRNPLSRFISAASIDLAVNLSVNWKLDTVDNVLDYITFQKNGCGSCRNSWFRPQWEFVNKNCLVWKFEDGFGENFKKFLLENLNIKLHNLNVNWKNPLDKKLQPINLDMEIVQQAISIAYKTDYDRFYRFPSG